ncbi:U3 small nucleolar RNA-associated protein 4 homolog [Argonauta hians]
MGDFTVHQVRFYSPKLLGIRCLSYCDSQAKLALARTDGSIEILKDWYRERVIPRDVDRSVETVLWVCDRLFSAGGSGEMVEYDLLKLEPKVKVHCNAGPIWCSAKNSENTRIAVGTESGCIVLFDVEMGGMTYLRSFSKQEGRILCLDWHVSGDVIVTGGVDNIRVWNANVGIAKERFTLKRGRQKETVVWCIKILADMTVISGDSQGRLTFWDSKYGTELMNINSHKADILCLAVSKDEKTVVCSGVDPKVAWFELCCDQPEGVPFKRFKTQAGAPASQQPPSKWVPSYSRTMHANDVNALVIAGDEVICGGADSYIIRVRRKRDVFKITGIPQKKLVHIADSANMVLLQYTAHLELWQLGHTSADAGVNVDILPLDSSPVHLAQLKSKGDHAIVCSTLSSNATMLAYSTVTDTRIYYISLVSGGCPTVKYMKQYSDKVPPAHAVVFTPDSARCVVATNTGALHILSFEHNDITCIRPDSQLSAPIHLLEVSSDSQYLASGCCNREINIFNTVTGEHVAMVPKHPTVPTAMTFHPVLPMLFIVYADMQLAEFSVSEKTWSQWSRKKCRKGLHPQWLSRQGKVTGLCYNPTDPKQIILQDQEMICLLVKDQPFPDPKVRLFGKHGPHSDKHGPHSDKHGPHSDRHGPHSDKYGPHSGKHGPHSDRHGPHSDRHGPHSDRHGPHSDKHAFHIVNKFKYILGSGFLSNGQMVIVEKTPQDFKEDLLPVLRVKKFGMG